MKNSKNNIYNIIKEIIKEELIYDKEIDDYNLKIIKGIVNKLNQAIKEKKYSNIHWFIGNLKNWESGWIKKNKR